MIFAKGDQEAGHKVSAGAGQGIERQAIVEGLETLRDLLIASGQVIQGQGEAMD